MQCDPPPPVFGGGGGEVESPGNQVLVSLYLRRYILGLGTSLLLHRQRYANSIPGRSQKLRDHSGFETSSAEHRNGFILLDSLGQKKGKQPVSAFALTKKLLCFISHDFSSTACGLSSRSWDELSHESYVGMISW